MSIQPVLKMLEQMPERTTVYLCLNNDAAGQKACQRMAEQLDKQGIASVRIAPKLKDWNDDLVAQFQKQEVSALCQTMCGR